MPKSGWSKIIAIVLSQNAKRISDEVSSLLNTEVNRSTSAASLTSNITAKTISATKIFRLYNAP